MHNITIINGLLCICIYKIYSISYDAIHISICVHVIAAGLGDPGQWQQTDQAQQGQVTGAAGVGDSGQRGHTTSEPGYMYDSVGFECVYWLSVGL